MLNHMFSLVSLLKEPTSFLGHTSPEPMPMLPLIFSDETTDAGEGVVLALLLSPSNAVVCHK